MSRSVMVDIETADTDDFMSLILSVGLVEFKLSPEQPYFFNQRLWLPSLRQQIARGRTTSRETLAFWADQSDVARAHWLKDTEVECEVFAQEFAEIVHVDNTAELWANGVMFDLGNIETLIRSVGKPRPWFYNIVRDCRTVLKTPQLRTRPDIKNSGALHDPIVDCKNQIWGLWERLGEVT